MNTVPITPLPAEEKRALFECGVAALKAKSIADFPLSPLIVNGKLFRYMDSDTDSAWIGFQLACNALKSRADSVEVLVKALEMCVDVLSSMDTLRHLSPEFPALDFARTALASVIPDKTNSVHVAGSTEQEPPIAEASK